MRFTHSMCWNQQLVIMHTVPLSQLCNRMRHQCFPRLNQSNMWYNGLVSRLDQLRKREFLKLHSLTIRRALCTLYTNYLFQNIKGYKNVTIVLDTPWNITVLTFCKDFKNTSTRWQDLFRSLELLCLHKHNQKSKSDH